MIDKIDNLINKYRALENAAGTGLHKKENQVKTFVYGAQYNNLKIFFEGEEAMRVLFVRPSIYDTVCDWYERMADIQNNRKTTVICKSSEEFNQLFDPQKFGASYTTFYFDDMLSLGDVFDLFRNLIPLYRDVNTRYISENKMRRISISYLMNNNRFDVFQSFSVDPDCLEDVIKETLTEYNGECVCYSLL